MCKYMSQNVFKLFSLLHCSSWVLNISQILSGWITHDYVGSFFSTLAKKKDEEKVKWEKLYRKITTGWPLPAYKQANHENQQWKWNSLFA